MTRYRFQCECGPEDNEREFDQEGRYRNREAAKAASLAFLKQSQRRVDYDLAICRVYRVGRDREGDPVDHLDGYWEASGDAEGDYDWSDA